MESGAAASGLAASRGDDDDEVATLRAENGFLEDQLQRALKELRVYQQQAAKERDVVVQAAEAMPDLPAWNTRAAAMTPLVRAYDQRIEELGQLNKIQAEKLGALAGRVESLVNENEGLLEELQALKEQKGVADGNEDGDGGLLVQMLKAENAALQEEAEAAAHEVGRAREAAAVKEQQCHQLLHDLREMDAEVRALEGKVTDLRGERDRFQQLLIERASEPSGSQAPAAEALAAAAQQLDAAYARIVALEAALQQGQQQGEGGAAEAAMAASVLAAARQRIEVLEDALQKQQNGAAALAAAAECEGAQQCIGELRAQIAARDQEVGEARMQLARLIRELEGARGEGERMLRRMRALEGQEQALRQAVEEALLERDRLRATEQLARRELSRLRAQLSHPDGVVSDAASGLCGGGESKAELLAKFERREAELKALAAEAAAAQAEAARCKREQKSAAGLYAELCAVVQEGGDGGTKGVEELRGRVKELEVGKERAETRAVKAIGELRRAREEGRAKEEGARDVKRRLEERGRVLEEERAALLERQARAERVAREKTQEAGALKEKIEEREGAWRKRMEALRAAHQEEVEVLQRKLRAAEAALWEQEPVLTDFHDRQARLLKRIEKEHHDLVKRMEKSMNQHRVESKRAGQENQALLARVASLTHELDAARREREGLRAQVAASHARVIALGSQLSDSLASQQRLLASSRRKRGKEKELAAAAGVIAGPAAAAGLAAEGAM